MPGEIDLAHASRAEQPDDGVAGGAGSGAAARGGAVPASDVVLAAGTAAATGSDAAPGVIRTVFVVVWATVTSTATSVGWNRLTS